jgi:hypothetical protein
MYPQFQHSKKMYKSKMDVKKVQEIMVHINYFLGQNLVLLLFKQTKITFSTEMQQDLYAEVKKKM